MLLDRSMMIELDRISKEKRKVESEIMTEFLAIKTKATGLYV